MHDPQLQMLLPADDEPEPEFSIVLPALNEELTIAEMVAWCRQGLADAGVRGEILIVDSSTDRTAEIALAAGVRVLKVPRRGLGRAYIDSLPFLRGRYVIMGDADCTYDFRRLTPFVQRFREGYEYIMGSRFSGSIERGSMPWLHRYVGTPFTTAILNFIFGSSFSDIHCGMRAIGKDALLCMDLHSQSWEYASEMVLKSVRMGLKTAEVPVTFYKDRGGRLSHHRRSGWWSPWLAGWINLRAMFVHGVDSFLFRPGLVLFATGLLLVLPMSLGPIRIGPFTFSLYWMMLGLTLSALGLHGVYLGILGRILTDYGDSHRKRWLARFRYDRSVLASAACGLLGLGALVPLVERYLRSGLRLEGPIDAAHHQGVLGLLLIIVAAMNFTFTLALHAMEAYARAKRKP